MSDSDGAFGPHIKALRDAKGWTQGELARAIGMSRGTVWNIETGKVTPDTTTLVKLAAALEAELADLTGRLQGAA